MHYGESTKCSSLVQLLLGRGDLRITGLPFQSMPPVHLLHWAQLGLPLPQIAHSVYGVKSSRCPVLTFNCMTGPWLNALVAGSLVSHKANTWGMCWCVPIFLTEQTPSGLQLSTFIALLHSNAYSLTVCFTPVSLHLFSWSKHCPQASRNLSAWVPEEPQVLGNLLYGLSSLLHVPSQIRLLTDCWWHGYKYSGSSLWGHVLGRVLWKWGRFSTSPGSLLAPSPAHLPWMSRMVVVVRRPILDPSDTLATWLIQVLTP